MDSMTTENQLSNSRYMINQEINQSRQNSITRAISDVSPAVVGINVVQIKRYRAYSWFDNDPFWGWYFGPREIQKEVKGLGSGFLISSDGYVLTNQHVVDEAVEIVVTTVGGQQYQAKTVGEDMKNDVALLKIDGKDFPYIPLGNSDDIIIGEWAIALGNPFGLFDINSNPTVTVVAIPINTVKKILPDLKKIGERVRTFQTGLEVENINWLVARMLGISQNDGVIISRVARKSPAENAGLEIGDVIVALDNERIRSTADVDKIIQSIDINKKLELNVTLFRNGKLYETAIKLK